jgi:ubiquinone/menaquinone biosynthesis C-methylase UbiE
MLFNVCRSPIAALAAVLCLSVPLGARQDHQDTPRDQWQRVTDVFEAMALGPGSVVADLGAGGGWFTTRLARAVGTGGRVYAVDVNPVSLRELREGLPKELTNIEIVRGEENDPKLPPGQLDAVLVVNAYHEFAEYPAVLSRVREALKPGGRLVVIEPAPRRAEDTTRAAQTRRHTIAMALVEDELAQAGYEIVRKDPEFVSRPAHQESNGTTVKPTDWLLVARRPADTRPFER